MTARHPSNWRQQRIANLEDLLRRYLDDHNRACRAAGLATKCDCDLCSDTRGRFDPELSEWQSVPKIVVPRADA